MKEWNGFIDGNWTKDIDVSDLSSTITLNDPDTIANIAPTAIEADSKFGLTMTTGNTGWQTKGTTNYLRDSNGISSLVGTTEYLGDNSTTTPTFSFYISGMKYPSAGGTALGFTNATHAITAGTKYTFTVINRANFIGWYENGILISTDYSIVYIIYNTFFVIRIR